MSEGEANMRTILVAAAAVLAVGGLVGCNDSGTTDGGKPTGTANTTAAASAGNRTTENAAPQKVSTTLPTKNDATVDARDYQQGQAFYFQSPSGNILCGFNVQGGATVGCQLAQATSVPPELADCGTRPDREVAAEITGTTPKFRCLNQGLYVGQPLDGGTKGGGKVLPYDATIIVRGAACTSLRTGVRCDIGGHGFTLAAEAQSLF
ncbi:hypothetical protein [Nocardia arthritidis]|uniref:Uncharacterized protein n=1 Tax=Nocardia arthritidis TaxID=228602 RepID=A0A6G9Y7T3_9NOCA|nr:hypothetical protein [Nocardia arthritidis]QIS09126.1 hypothetical protein F5544_06075 [Nocardia arthritidis]